MHPETKVRIMDGAHNTSKLDKLSFKVVRLKEVTRLLNMVGVIESIQVFVMRARWVVSSVVRMGISSKIVQINVRKWYWWRNKPLVCYQKSPRAKGITRLCQ